MMQWQPIETAPKDGTKVLATDDNGLMGVINYVERWHVYQEFVRQAKDGDVYKTVRKECGYWDADFCPTHWMPLPEPPHAAP